MRPLCQSAVASSRRWLGAAQAAHEPAHSLYPLRSPQAEPRRPLPSERLPKTSQNHEGLPHDKMRVPDHYAALGIQETADAADIRKAYKKRALQTHPDKGGDEEEFKRVGAAYAVLSDQDKRRDYDEMRTDGLRQGARDQTDYQCTGFNSAFDAPFFGQRWDPGEKFSMDDARGAQFDRFFGTQSPFANLSTPAARKVTQISTIRRRDGRSGVLS